MVCCRLQYNLLTFYFSLKELPANSHIDHVLQFWFYIQQHDDTDRIALEVSIDLRKAQYEKQLAGKLSKQMKTPQNSVNEKICANLMRFGQMNSRSLTPPPITTVFSLQMSRCHFYFIQREEKRTDSILTVSQTNSLHQWCFYGPLAESSPRQKQIYSRHRRSQPTVRTQRTCWLPYWAAKRGDLHPVSILCLAFVLFYPSPLFFAPSAL